MEEYFEIHTHKESGWECIIFGFGGKNPMSYKPSEGSVPNWFHRKMQELFFGVKWRRVIKR